MSNKRAWFYDLLFILILLMAGYLRLTGVNWGEGYHQHPDELFMMGVVDNLRAHTCEDSLTPVEACPPEQKHWITLGEYFDSAKSMLNPYNRGNAVYVYGDLPLTLVRVAMEATNNEDIGNSKFFARQISALADLLTIFLLYLIVSKLYGRRIGLFAATFSAFAVMQIQQSHFFTSDLFVNLFMFLAIYFAVGIIEHNEPEIETLRGELETGNPESENLGTDDPLITNYELRTSQVSADADAYGYRRVLSHPLLWLSVGFGFALGMAMASKINAAALAIMLPGAFVVRLLVNKKGINNDVLKFIAICLVAGGFATIISFRIFQPYAFDGLRLNPQWVANISEQRAQASGEADLPWNLQWARRTHLYSFTNLTVWGLGLPLGFLAWAGFLLMGWRIIKGEYRHLLLWGWTAFYFGWQSLQFNPTMRYQLPIYPLLCMMAAWFLFELPKIKKSANDGQQAADSRPLAAVSALVGVVVLTLTVIWAFAFQSIYLRDETRMAASRWIFENMPGPVNIHIDTDEDGTYNQPLPVPADMVIEPGVPFVTTFVPNQDGQISEIVLGHAKDAASPATVVMSLFSAAAPDTVLATATESVDSSASDDVRGPSVTFSLDHAVPVTKGEPYILKLETLGSGLTLAGSSLANETDYDFGLPFRVDGYDPFGGMYRGDLNLQVYWDDNADKLNRYIETLNSTDYILIPTNHQYAQITRLPERYPLTTLYYRELLGCPPEENIIKCYQTAEPGKYKGNLGFELAAVFESYPTLGPLVINDQSAEEAFTFYDHPKVLIFKKTDDFNLAKVSSLLGSVDLTKAVHLTPKQASDYKDLLLPDTSLAAQRAGGTWSELFDYDWIQNKYPFVGVLIWYLFIFVLGLFAYPIARLALPGIRHYSYPLGRIVGLVLLAWISWMGGSVGIPYTRLSIGAAFAIVAVAGVSLWMMRRDQFKADWNSNRRFFVMVEILFFVFFLIDLIIRLGNPDLWHPSKGGERPMDFSYFNAVLKSTSFPPYDPWYAGGYINYYYYGFVLAGTVVKLLGIIPSIAFNFILPTWFALIAVGAFAIGWNLLDNNRDIDADNGSSFVDNRLVSGIAAAFMAILIGNLGTIQMVFNAFQRIAVPGGLVPADATIFQKWGWAVQGMWLMLMQHAQLPIGRGEWYWNPSRVIPPGPGNEITEFPLFTLLYSDLHAHMLVMPLVLLIIAWALSFVRTRAQLTRGEWIAAFGIGSLAIGALKPTNTWDLYTYYLFAAVVVAYTLIRYFDWKDYFKLPAWVGKIGVAVGAALLLYILSALLYFPFSQWFGSSYTSVDWWQASRTPISSYLTQWSLFLFIIAAWLAWETHEWMAVTPVSHLSKLQKYVLLIEIAIAIAISLLLYFMVDGVWIGLIALPMVFWTATLILRPDTSDEKRFTLFLIGTGLMITIVVEFITLAGDIGRMNTIFKLYLQVWMLLAVSAAAAFGWLITVFPFWRPRWRTIFQVGLYALLAGAFMFTITASTDKISDRLNPLAPHTLDSMAYMKYSQHWDGQMMELSEDYNAIRWLQDNVKGSPVIVEANCTEYRWCTRMTIYTGLPGVVGWNWHQRQQRGAVSLDVQQRVDEIGTFYTTPDIEWAHEFLKKYLVKYIVVGQLERNIYPALEGVPDGLAKFEQFEGKYWKSVYHDKNTTIYEVLP